MKNATKNTAAAIFLLANTSFATTTAMADTPQTASEIATTTTASISSTASVTPALSKQQQQIKHAASLAQSGREALSFIVAARQLLLEEHNDEAGQYLEKAKQLLTSLEKEIPAGEDKNTALLPIYSQMGVKEGVEITEETKQKLMNTHLDAVKGNHKKVVEALQEIDIELQYSFLDLPVDATLEKVESALELLSAKETKQAADVLSKVEEGLVHESIIVNGTSENPAG